MKYLLNWWRAKDIQEVTENNEKINISNLDKLDFNYLRHPKPVQVLDKMIKNGYLDEYDYLILTSPDLVVKQEHVQALIANCERLHPKVMCGVCNIDMRGGKNDLAVCMDPVYKTNEWNTRVMDRNYKWVKKGEKTGIHRVGFNGKALMALHKDVFKKFQWTGKKIPNPNDLQICSFCIEHNIPMYADFDIEMKHMRYYGKLLAGKIGTEVWWKGKQIQLNNPDFFPDKITFIS